MPVKRLGLVGAKPEDPSKIHADILGDVLRALDPPERSRRCPGGRHEAIGRPEPTGAPFSAAQRRQKAGRPPPEGHWGAFELPET